MLLRALKVLNCYWANTQINDSLENWAAMNAVHGKIFASRTVIDDLTIMALDRIAYDNPAQLWIPQTFKHCLWLVKIVMLFWIAKIQTLYPSSMCLSLRDGDESIAIAGPLSGQQRMLEAIRNLGHEMEGETTKEQAQ